MPLKKFSFHSILLLFILLIGCAENRDEMDTIQTSREAAETETYVTLINNEAENRVDVLINGAKFTSYLYSDTFKKPILYPINSPAGNTVTRGFPLDPRAGESQDHPHQVGLWLNYGDVNGLDFWNHSDRISEERKHAYGTIIHKEIKSINSGDSHGELDVVKEWQTHDGEVLLLENTTFMFYGDEYGGNTGSRTIDRITRLTAPDKDISLTDNKEGMLGLRLARELEHPDEHADATGMYRSSEGLEGHDVWGTRAKWMNLTGRINGENISIAILDYPENVGFPTYWHARGYGLYAANPLGMKEMSGGAEELNYTLEAGGTLTFNHRIIVWSGSALTDEHIESSWQEWVSE